MAGKRHISPARWLFFGLLAAGAVGLCVPLMRSQGAGGSIHAGSTTPGGIYAADLTPELMPQQLLPGLILLSPEQLTRVPEVDGFQSPCGTAHGAMSYDAQPFGSQNPTRGGQHCGQDLNGIGGENTDLGEPVHAAARGLVVYSGTPGEAWGNVVVLAHRLPGTQRIIQTLYAHLDRRLVQVGELVGRGARLGTIGTADGRYLAHLHYEAIESLCTEAGMPGYSPQGTMNRLDPASLQAQYPAPAWADAYESLRRQQISAQATRGDNATPATKLPEGSIPVHPSQFLTN